MKEFRWNAWNRDHATVHGCGIDEIESIVRHPGRGFPRKIGDEKLMIERRGIAGRKVRVVYELDADDTVYVNHAMPLTTPRRRSR